VEESVLNSLYERASIFAFPSLDEGFGMPALEAMARGIPVLSSNRGAMKEVCGDAALLVDPTQTEAMAHGLRRLIDEEVMRKDLSQRGIARAAQFTWERAARETWNVYREMM
jgi:glycosyltransferase involved in cell wall biosynthesis